MVAFASQNGTGRAFNRPVVCHRPVVERMRFMENLTVILSQMGSGSQLAKSQLLDAVYEELRRMASVKLKSELPGQTLQATELVHEAWMRLLDNVGEMSGEWQNRRHFFGAAAEAMRRILIERARSKKRLKRGGPNAQRQAFTDIADVPQSFEDDVLDLHAALEHFEREDPLRAQVVKLKFFAGLTTREIAEITDLSVATVERYWVYARAWLHGKMSAKIQ